MADELERAVRRTVHGFYQRANREASNRYSAELAAKEAERRAADADAAERELTAEVERRLAGLPGSAAEHERVKARVREDLLTEVARGNSLEERKRQLRASGVRPGF